MLQTLKKSIPTRPITSGELPRVRVAVPEDLPQLMALCKSLHEENGVANVDWDGVASKMMQGIAQHQALIGVIGKIGAIEGAIYMEISSFWYSKDVMLQELFAYVLPAYRRSNNAKALLEFGKSCTYRFNVPLLIGIISNHRTREKIRLYSRRLGAPSGAFFLVNGTTGAEGKAEDR